MPAILVLVNGLMLEEKRKYHSSRLNLSNFWLTIILMKKRTATWVLFKKNLIYFIFYVDVLKFFVPSSELE